MTLSLAPALALLAALAPTALTAQTPLDAAAFEAYVTGKTITYHRFGQPFGTEEYLPDRQVRWSVTEDLCQYGTWYPRDEAICFVYEQDPTPHCWTFWFEGGVLTARSLGAPPGAELYEAASSDTPLPCPGPDVGV